MCLCVDKEALCYSIDTRPGPATAGACVPPGPHTLGMALHTGKRTSGVQRRIARWPTHLRPCVTEPPTTAISRGKPSFSLQASAHREKVEWCLHKLMWCRHESQGLPWAMPS